MAIVYFDASALVKLVVEEDGTDIASQLWDACDAAVASRLAYPEVRAALAASHRNRELSAEDLASAEADWEEYWQAVRPVELTRQVEQHAGGLARDHALRGADAIHLASALAVGTEDIVVAVWDRRLRAGANAVGLRLAPAELVSQGAPGRDP